MGVVARSSFNSPHNKYFMKIFGGGYIIKDEEGNEIGKFVLHVGGLAGGETNLFDSKGNKWGRVKAKVALVGRPSYLFYDHNEILVAKMKPKTVQIRPSFWVEDPKGKKIYEIRGNLDETEFKIKDTTGTIVSQITSKHIFHFDWTLKIHNNMNALIALLIIPAIIIFRGDQLFYGKE